MFEGDDDPLLKEAKANRQFDPNKYYKLKKELEAKQKKDDMKKEHQSTIKQLNDKQQQLKQEMGKKGVQTADQKQKFEDMKKADEAKQASEDASASEAASSTV